MVFNKTFFLFALVAVSFVSAFPAGTNEEKTEAKVEATTESIVNDDVPVTTEVVLSDDVTTSLPVDVKPDPANDAPVVSELVPEVITPTGEVPAEVIVLQEKPSSIVIAETVGDKIVPVVQVVNVPSPVEPVKVPAPVEPVKVPSPVEPVKSEANPKDNAVEGRRQ